MILMQINKDDILEMVGADYMKEIMSLMMNARIFIVHYCKTRLLAP